MIDLFNNGLSIVAGSDAGSGGHVVVIHKIHMPVVQTGTHTVERYQSGYIEWVEFTDPQTPDDAPLKIMSGNDFMSDCRFNFALYQEP